MELEVDVVLEMEGVLEMESESAEVSEAECWAVCYLEL